ncbi:MAG: hypothetical protein ACRCXQ_11305, partial [Vagococcus fluvialis]
MKKMGQSFQKVNINFELASKEFLFNTFNSMKELKQLEHYIHKSSMITVLDWVSNYQEIVNNTSKNLETHNIFSVVGERGTGKSSFMETLNFALETGVYIDENKENQGAVFSLSVIDPNIFDNMISLLEFIVSKFKSHVDSINKSMEYNEQYKDSYNIIRYDFNNQIRSVFEVLKSIRINKSDFAESKSGLEVFENIEEKSSFRDKMSDLIDTFLNIMSTKNNVKYTQLVILIDDLDLVKNSDVYHMLQDCFKFFMYQKKVLMVISYREKQLTNSVMDHLIQQNSNLLVENIIEIDELKEQAANFIEKGLPRQQRVYLLITKNTSVYSILYPFVEKVDEINHLKNIKLEEFIHNELIKQTRIPITPIDGAELTQFVFPHTLRSTIQYLQMIHEFSEYQTDFDLKKLRKNIKKFKYFFLSLLQDALPRIYFEVVDDFFNSESYYKNSMIIKKISAFLVDKETNYTDRSNYICQKEVYNCSLGDVYESMFYFKLENSDEISNHFIYALKLSYTIDMLLMLTKSIL